MCEICGFPEHVDEKANFSSDPVGQNPSTDTVAGSTATTATISVGGTVNGFVNTSGDQDWYRITLDAGQSYAITMTGSGGLDTYVRLLNSSGGQINFDDDSGPGTDSRLTFTASNSGTYYISAQGFSSSVGGYALNISQTATLPVFTIPEISDQLINGYWNSTGSSPNRWAVANTDITFNVQGLTADRAIIARLAFATWGEFTGLTFTETTGSAELTLDDADSGAYSSSTTSGGIIQSSFINVATSWSGGTSAMDSYTFQTFIHEIGHSIGLGHGGNYNGSATYGVDNHYQNDTWQYTIMSYNSQNNYGGASYRFIMTPQMADIYAALSLYGAGSVRAGNTVYGFNVSGQESATAALYNFNSYTSAPSFTIYDSGGTDTLDCSGYSANQNISLVGGTWSDVGGLIGNIGIYITSVIENATGGSGTDTFTLSNANVANVINGNGGSDTVNVTYNFGSGYTIQSGSTATNLVMLGSAGTDTFQNVEFVRFANGTTVTTASLLSSTGGDTPSDFNGDGTSDILFQHSSGTIAQWRIGNGAFVSSSTIGFPGSGWTAVGTGDFNGNGTSDILYQHTSGTIAQWNMSNGTFASSTVIGGAGTGWTAIDTGDFNGDGTSDILFQNTNGSIAQWQISNGAFVGSTLIGGAGAGWTAIGTGDFNGNGTSDILFRHTSGTIAQWNISNGSFVSSTTIGNAGSGWTAIGTGDFNGNGTSDILFQHTNGTIAQWNISNGTFAGSTVIGGAGSGWTARGTGDFNGDGTSDILFQHTSGIVAQWQINNGSFASSTTIGSAPGWALIV